jgi:hypothetical protein
MASKSNALFHGRNTIINSKIFKFIDRLAKLAFISVRSTFKNYRDLARRLILSMSLGLISASTYSAELFEVFMDDPEHLESMSSICINMHEDEYYESDLCEHAAQAIYLLKLQQLGDINALTQL